MAVAKFDVIQEYQTIELGLSKHMLESAHPRELIITWIPIFWKRINMKWDVLNLLRYWRELNFFHVSIS